MTSIADSAEKPGGVIEEVIADEFGNLDVGIRYLVKGAVLKQFEEDYTKLGGIREYLSLVDIDPEELDRLYTDRQRHGNRIRTKKLELDLELARISKTGNQRELEELENFKTRLMNMSTEYEIFFRSSEFQELIQEIESRKANAQTILESSLLEQKSQQEVLESQLRRTQELESQMQQSELLYQRELEAERAKKKAARRKAMHAKLDAELALARAEKESLQTRLNIGGK